MFSTSFALLSLCKRGDRRCNPRHPWHLLFDDKADNAIIVYCTGKPVEHDVDNCFHD